jgi:hypothetical protein
MIARLSILAALRALALLLPASAMAQSTPPGLAACRMAGVCSPALAQVWCTSVFEDGMPQQHCGSLESLTWEAKVKCAQYDALPNQNTLSAIHASGRCFAAKLAVQNVVGGLAAREMQRQRIEDARRELNALGAPPLR